MSRNASERDHPRLRGEKRVLVTCSTLSTGSSPLTRGKGAGARHSSQDRRIIPAYAGKSQSLDVWHLADEDHPRLRGEKAPALILSVAFPGSSPLTRGKVSPSWLLSTMIRIIPAYAGKSGKLERVLRARQDHPRLRGEKFLRKSVSRN